MLVLGLCMRAMGRWLNAATGIWLMALCGYPAWLAGQSQPQVLAQTLPGQNTIVAEVQSVSDRSGGVILALRRTPSGHPPQLVIQRLTSSGAKLFAEDGIPLSDPEARPGTHAVLADGEGGAFVVWEQTRDNMTLVQAQRISARGQLLWGAQGVRITRAPVGQYNPVLVPDYNGGIVICWEQAVATAAGTERDLYLQRLNESGVPLFGPQGVPVCRAPGLQQRVQLDVSPGQNIVVLWEDFRAGSKWVLYTQQLDFQGRTVWPADGISLAPARNLTQRWPSTFTDGFGGLFCVYEALGGLNIDKDIYIVRVNRSGKVVYQNPVCATTGDQTRPQVRKQGAEAWIVWEDWRSGNADVWLQVVDIQSGELRLEPAGRPVAVLPGAQQAPRLEFGSVGGEAIVLWEDAGVKGMRLQAQRLTRNAMRTWQPEGVTVAQGMGNPPVYSTASNEAGGCWLSWVASGGDEAGLAKVQQVDQGGRLQLGLSGLSLQPPATQQPAPFGVIVGASVTNAPGAYLAWEDNRAGGGSDIYLQRLDGRGVARWRPGGIPVCTAPGRQSLPVLAPVAGGVYVGWIDRRTKDDNLYLQFVDTAGQVRWRTDGISVCLAPQSQNSLRLLPLGNDVLAVWVDSRNLRYRGFDLYTQRINQQGQMAWTLDGRPLQATGGFQTAPVLLPDPSTQGAIVTWTEESTAGRYNLVTLRLTRDGLPGGPVQAVEPASEQQRYPAGLSLPGGDLWVAWTQAPAGAEASQLRLQMLSRYHVRLFPQGRSPAPATGGRSGMTAEAPRLHPLGIGLALVWLAGPSPLGSSRSLYLQWLDRAGNSLLPQGPSILATGLEENTPCQLLNAGEHLYLAWQAGPQAASRVMAVNWHAPNAREQRRYQPTSSLGSVQEHPYLVSLAGGRVAMVWAETSRLTGLSQLRLQVLD